MKVAIGADHAGFQMKNSLAPSLRKSHQVIDTGASTYDSQDDYPDIVLLVTREVTSGRAERGIIICGSGVGACIAANKVPGIRACLCHDTYSAHQGVEHDDMNVLCLGARIIGEELAIELATAFLGADFDGAAHHKRRVEKVIAIERLALQGKPRELAQNRGDTNDPC